MNLLDIYEGREPHQQAIDKLEKARIDHLKEKMDYYAKHRMVKDFQKAKKEYEEIHKIKDECMGYGSLGEADQVPAPTQPVRAGTDLVTPQQRVQQSTPQKQTPVGKVASTVKNAAKWLAGKGGPGREGPTYEDKKQKKKFTDPQASNEIRKIRAEYPSASSDAEAILKRDLDIDQGQDKAIQSLSVITKDLESELNSLKQTKPAEPAATTIAEPMATPAMPPISAAPAPTPTIPPTTNSAPASAMPTMDLPAPGAVAEPSKTAKRTDTVKPVAKAKRTAKFVQKPVAPVKTTTDRQPNTKVQIPSKAPVAGADVIDFKQAQAAAQEKKTGSGLDQFRTGTFGESIKEQQPSPVIGSMVQQLEKPGMVKQNFQVFSNAYDNLKGCKLNYGGSANVPLTWATMDAIVSTLTAFAPAQQQETWAKLFSDPNYLQGFLSEYVPQRGLLEADVIPLAQQRQAPDQLKAYSRALEILRAAKDPNIPSDRVNMLKQALFKDFGTRIQQAPDGHYYITYQGKQIKLPQLTAAYIEEDQRLHRGDPVVVTAPNEFEGKTGEIYELSPSGTFAIVDLYNHGKHSMHLSDVEYNDYADQEQDDWYDDIDDGPQHAYDSDERTRSDQFEGFVPLDKYSPTAVCLAGKPVKKFDYYKDAERFHNNWKQKLYREGNKEKADKITLMPLNLDEGAVNPQFVIAQVTKLLATEARRITNAPMAQLLAPVMKEYGLTLQQIDSMMPGGLKKAAGEYGVMMKEAGSPAQQAAIAIAMKKAGKKPKQVDEAGDRIDPILIKALNRMPDGLATHREVLDAAYDAYAMELGRMRMKSEYGTTNAYIPQLLDLYKQKHGLTFNEEHTPAPVKPPRSPRGFNKQGTGLGNKLADLNRKEWEEKKKKEQGVAEDAGSWIVYDPETRQIKKRFKTHTAGKSYAKVHNLGFASSEYYFDRVKDNKEVADEAIVASGPSHPLDDRAIRKMVWDTMKINADTGEQALQRALSVLAKKPQSRMVQDLQDKFQNLSDRLAQGVLEGAMSNLHADLSDVYSRMAPGIERHRDSFKAGQLYDALEAVAEQHGAEAEFKRMMSGARNRAHMDYDTNPGGFQNWFWYLPFAEEELSEEQDTNGVERAILNRIMVAHTDLLMKFGPEKVMQAAEEVAYNVGDVDEIGTSDVSAYVNQVKQILGVPEELDEKWSQKYKSSINCANPKGFSQRAHCAGKKKK